MSPSRPFILRPVATSLLMAAILLAGVVAYKQLPVSALPEVDYPTIQVLTFYPGASPDVMASSVTAPLERQFGQVPGLNQMTSSSSGGCSVITFSFRYLTRRCRQECRQHHRRRTAPVISDAAIYSNPTLPPVMRWRLSPINPLTRADSRIHVSHKIRNCPSWVSKHQWWQTGGSHSGTSDCAPLL